MASTDDLNVTDGSIIIPFLPSIGIYDFSCDINARGYLFDVRWNGTEKAWYFDLYDDLKNVIGINNKIVLGCFIGRRHDHVLFREGVFVATDLSGAKKEFGFDDVGTRCIVQYVPVLELIYRSSQVP